MMDWVTFGIDMDVFKNEYLPDQTHWGWDTNIYYIPDSWQSITESIPSYRTHLVIKTGKVSNITVVDISTMDAPDDIRQIIPSYTNDIYHVSSPNYRKQYYFEYEPALHSINEVRPGVSVLNDGRFTIASGREYSPWDRVPIAKMPKEMLRLLLQWQHEREHMDIRSYDLVSILDKEWIVKDAMFVKLVEALASAHSSNVVATVLRQLSVDKIGYVDERRLRLFLDCRITTSDYKRIVKEATSNNTVGMIDCNRLRLLIHCASRRGYTYTALKKFVRINHARRYIAWNAKHSDKPTATNATPATFYYLAGNITKLSDLKAVCPDITGPKLLAINPEWTISSLKICVDCKKRHYKNCCTSYSRDNRISCKYINNIQIG
jgi:hypothetical protein